MADEIIASGAAPGADAGGGTAVADAPVETEVIEEVPAGGGDDAPPSGNEDDAPPEPGEGDDPDAEVDGEAELAKLETDGRKVDAATRAALAKLAKTDPAAAKALRNDYFKAQAVVKETGSQNLSEAISKVRAMNATINALGGEEGITELQNEVTDYRQEIEQFSNGDPKLLEQLYNSNPQATVNSAQNLLDLLSTKDMKAYDNAIIPSMHKRFESANLYGHVDAIKNFVKEGKGQEAFDLLEELGGWLGKVKGQAKTLTEGRTQRDPKAEALTAREQAIVEKEKKAYTDTTNQAVQKLTNGSLAKVAADFVKDMKFSVEARRKFFNQVNVLVYEAMGKDKVYLRNAANLRAKGDPEIHAKFVADKYAEVIPEIYRKYRNEMYPNYKPGTGPAKPAAKAAPAKPGAPAAPKIVAGMSPRPHRDDVDWTKTDSINFITGKGVTLKNGKVINFDTKAN